ncbi:uncharacterized protein LOC130694521 [Daphnia carinata]|uniref:uncharacterized protein LOC130694521 n=1 Tax=Daphnia carinata TaxID=120202 RepID=UPI00257C33C2|nr:uncharacterized protein LOC130694521 [Daphnia carinata]
MALFNKFFGIKKEVPAAAPHTTVTVTNEIAEHDGYVIVPTALESHQLRQGPLPYAISSKTAGIKQEIAASKVYDEIPFQFSPAYSRMWSTGTAMKHHPKILKEIDWDSLCYDFTLEKSILQS